MDSRLVVGKDEQSMIIYERLKKAGVKFFALSSEDKEAKVFFEGRRFFEIYETPNPTPFFANSLRRPFVPSLFYWGEFSYSLGLEAYFSLDGVNSFLRKLLLKDPSKRYFLEDIKTFYDSKTSTATCFNAKDKIIFKGPSDSAPYNIKKILNKHSYKMWGEVECWEIGNLKEISSKVNEDEIVLGKQNGVILFPEELESLKKGEIIPLSDSRSLYHVEFEALHLEGDSLFRITASMFN